MFNLKLLSVYLITIWHLASAISIYWPLKSSLPILKSKECDNDSSEFLSDNKPFFISDEKLTWFEAEAACLTRGLYLVFPGSYQDSINMRLHVSATYPPLDIYTGYWVGGFKKTDADDFHWLDGKPIGNVGWLLGEPNSFPGERCIEMKKENSHVLMGWNNLYCDELRRYICRGWTPNETYKQERVMTAKVEESEVEKNITEIPIKFVVDLNAATPPTTPKSTTITTSSTTAGSISPSGLTTFIAMTSTSMAPHTTDRRMIIATKYITESSTPNSPPSSSQNPVNYRFPIIRNTGHLPDTFRSYSTFDDHDFQRDTFGWKIDEDLLHH